MKKNGLYPLIDYINFKGEGANPNEGYKRIRLGTAAGSGKHERKQDRTGSIERV